MQDMKAASDRITAAFHKRMPAVTAAMIEFQPVTAELSRVLFTVNTLDADRDAVRSAFEKQMPNGVELVARSFTEVSSTGGVLAVSGLVTRTHIVIEGEDIHKDGKFRVLSSNVLMDTEDKSLWNVESEGGVRKLSRVEDDSLADLLSEVSSTHAPQRRADLPKLANVCSSVQGCTQEVITYITYVDVGTRQVHSGFVESSDGGTLIIFNPAQNQSLEVNRSLVVQAVDCEVETSDAIRPDDFADMKGYYRKVFGYAPEYLRMFEQMIDQSTVA